MITYLTLVYNTVVSKNNIDLINKTKGHNISEGQSYEIGDDVEVAYEFYNDLGFNDAIIDFVKLFNQDKKNIKIKIRHDWE